LPASQILTLAYTDGGLWKVYSPSRRVLKLSTRSLSFPTRDARWLVTLDTAAYVNDHDHDRATLSSFKHLLLTVEHSILLGKVKSSTTEDSTFYTYTIFQSPLLPPLFQTINPCYP
jgi:hypothetical protein